MLISPPFLPPRGKDQSEDAWLDAAMRQVPNDGLYPLSYVLGWHGGIHLEAPTRGEGREPVRAIADGTILFARRGQNTRNDDPTHVLNYNKWTSDGVVVIEHNTEIGANAQNQVVAVRFYSIYMHLYEIPPEMLRPGRKVYRKDEIGRAGYIEGTPHRMHFEICCDSDNLKRLIGRLSGDLPITADGRSDVVFGDLYFYLPAGTPIYGECPLANNPVAHRQPPNGTTNNAPTPANAALTAAHTTTEALIVCLRYAMGEEVPLTGTQRSGRGDAVLTTLRSARDAQSKPLSGQYEALVAAVVEHNGEYNLYTTATRIADSYPPNNRPAPSAVYELLRFGRVINTAYETLTPANVPHWRRISYPGGQGWVNLNNQAPGQQVRKFSDADFPHWRGWTLIDDHADGDSRCDSATLRNWLSPERDWMTDPTLAVFRLDSPAYAARLAHTICCFPSEWDATTLDKRWGWLRALPADHPNHLDTTHYPPFAAFANALCFNASALFTAQWRFHPKEFIRLFRRCGWLSLPELIQLLPGNHPVGFSKMHDRLSAGYTTKNQILPAGLYFELNRVCRKYLLERAQRRAHFWGQIVQETDQLQTVREYASGAAYENRADLGNLQPGDGIRFRGRGVIQLTGRTHYTRYSNYRGRNFTIASNNLLLQTDAYAACDASTFYWIAEKTRDKVNNQGILDGLTGISRRADRRTFQLLTDNTSIQSDVSNVTKQVNRAQLGLNNRIQYFKYAYLLTSDTTETLQHANLRP